MRCVSGRAAKGVSHHPSPGVGRDPWHLRHPQDAAPDTSTSSAGFRREATVERKLVFMFTWNCVLVVSLWEDTSLS